MTEHDLSTTTKAQMPLDDTAQHGKELDKTPRKSGSFLNSLKKLFRRGDSDIREALADYIEESEDAEELDNVAQHERLLIGNVLKLRDMTVYDVMVPRADIAALDINSSFQDTINFIIETQHSRVPIYRDNLDNVVGFIHLKDLLNGSVENQNSFNLGDIIRDLPILSPSLPVLDLLMLMKQTKRHMAVVVDEYGGIDGLVTIEDLTESIVGEIDDEFDEAEQPDYIIKPEDNTIIADARAELKSLVEDASLFLGEDGDLEDIDTIGGYITNKIGRVPARGEVLRNLVPGLIFEIVEADPRRINRIRIKKLQQK